MNKVKILKSVKILLLSVVAGLATNSMAQDEDGCWTGRHSGGSCLEYNTYSQDNRTYFNLTNVCTERLYIRWCAGDRCGVDGLPGGQTKKKYEYATYVSTNAWAVGSNQPSKDWVCRNKMGW